MIKKFEEFICESAYRMSIMRKIIKDMESVKQNYTEDKGLLCSPLKKEVTKNSANPVVFQAYKRKA